MTENEVLGVVVTFNPDSIVLHSNLNALLKQTDQILVYDNGSADQNVLKKICGEYPGVRLIENGENLGLPVCYNKAMAYAIENGYAWLLIMDQDTVLPDEYVAEAKSYFSDPQTAIICPNYWDINAYSREEFEKITPKEDISYVKRCISSGSLVRVSCLEQLGGFDEAMFIDYVDYDYCRTVIDHGYRILQMNNCVMQHQIGNSRVVKLFNRPQVIHNHSGLRKYYFFRNRVYYARKHRLKYKENKSFYRGFIKLLILVFYEDQAVGKFGSSMKGILDGFRMPVRPTDKPSARGSAGTSE